MPERTWAAKGAWVIALGMSACGEPNGAIARAPTTTGIALDLREGASRPRVARLTRDGDPAGAIAIAVATPPTQRRAPVGNRALALLFAGRMARLGLPVSARDDGAGFRLSRSASTPSDAEQVVRALAQIVAAPATEAEAAIVSASLAALPLMRLPSDLMALADCSGDPGIGPTEPMPSVTGEALEGWRQGALEKAGVAVGVVGNSTFTDAATRALESGPSWPLRSTERSTGPLVSVHAATIGAMAFTAPAELDVAWTMPDPRRALQLAVELENPRSALAAKLAVRAAGWTIAGVRVTARPDGGCLRIRFDGAGIARKELAASAAAVLAIAETDIAAGNQESLDHALVAERIAASETALAAAERAAWWALAANAADVRLTASSVLSIAARRDDVDGTLTEFDAAYQSELIANASHGPNLAPRKLAATARVAVEFGQRESWMLLAHDCADAHETDWDAGHRALAALTASELPALNDVTIEPWVGPDGVGLMAHAARRAGETGPDLGRRLGSALGAALTSVPFAERRFARAHAKLLTQLSTPDRALTEALAVRVAPNQPSAHAPFGLLDRQVAVSRDEVEDRWRAMLDEPWRVAMLASIDAAEASSAAGALERWFAGPPQARCPTARKAAPPLAGEHRIAVRGNASRALVAIVADNPNEWNRVELLAAALARKTAPTERGYPPWYEASWQGGRRVPTLVLRLDVQQKNGASEVGTVQQSIADLRSWCVEPRHLDSASEAAESTRLAHDASPRGRIETLWLGGHGPLATAEQLRSFCRSHILPARIVTTLAEPSTQ